MIRLQLDQFITFYLVYLIADIIKHCLYVGFLYNQFHQFHIAFIFSIQTEFFASLGVSQVKRLSYFFVAFFPGWNSNGRRAG